MLSDGEEMFTGDSNFAVHLDLSSDLLLPNGDEPDMIDEELMAICRNSEFNRSSPVASQEGDSRFGLTFEPLVEEDEDEEDESPSASIGANVTSQPQQITEENQQQPLTNENFQLAYTFTCEVCGFEAENRRKFMIHK